MKLFLRRILFASVAFLVAASLSGCGASQRPAPLSVTEINARVAAVEAVLDAWHRAAAEADEEAYFAAFDPQGVFLGTDATERWGVEAFRAYAHPHFAAGRAWTFHPTRRAVDLIRGGELAYFDEDLDTEGLGPARGSGVLRRGEDGVFRILQYNLAITVPNERFREVRELLASEPQEVIPELAEGVDSGAQAGAQPGTQPGAQPGTQP